MYKELVDEIVFFSKELHRRVISSDVEEKQIFFLAREGLFLKKVYDLLFPYDSFGVKTHYMKVSRASTFLPSLQKLENEKFETLFRQYDHISPREFFLNLGMGDLLNDFRYSMGITDSEFSHRVKGFSESMIFSQILAQDAFRQTYEERRQIQKEALTKYFYQYCGKSEQIVIVDVGWKGTIQDHLHRVFQDQNSKTNLVGYYLGLLWPTCISPCNEKHGLIYSCDVDSQSTGYHVFNENRALYEVLLSANHGSAANYQLAKNGDLSVALSPFEEERQYQTLIKPWQEMALEILRKRNVNDEFPSFEQILASHQRMVFSPSNTELQFFETLYQPENFGVHEKSHFLEKPSRKKLITLILQWVATGDESKLGFWPYAFIKKNFGSVLANIYRWKQSRRDCVRNN